MSVAMPAHRVALSRGLAPAYGPESIGPVRDALGDLCSRLGWGDPGGAPLGHLVPPGGRVLVKPNWVLHQNRGPWTLEPLITNGVLIQAVVEAALASGAGRVLVADAPIQSCDFEELLGESGVGPWAEALRQVEPRFGGVQDLRRTIRRGDSTGEITRTDVQSLEHFTLFDLARDSLLEPVTTPEPKFRVTQYPPAQLARTHGPGRHRYLVAREVLDADLVINLPKLKTHKKGGITCALKNLVGINGNKEYLPHHRIGGAADGGDCYPARDPVKRALEIVLDRFNSSTTRTSRRIWRGATRMLQAVQNRRGDRIGVEGSWSGNDTVWRMCLDLNRILLYGRPDGTLAEAPLRRVIQIVDAIVAGQGEGPLRSEPLPLGLLAAGESAAALDWVLAIVLGYDPERVPIVREAFGAFRWPIADFPAGDITVLDAATGGAIPPSDLEAMTPEGVVYPAGWLDAVRRRP
jgi:uncharacterized protein (DUF362 family)